MSRNNRAKIRFKPDNVDFGFISFNLVEFQKDITTLILNESATGACLVINRKLVPSSINIKDGLSILVKIGNLEPEVSVIRWVTIIDDDLIKFGIEH